MKNKLKLTDRKNTVPCFCGNSVYLDCPLKPGTMAYHCLACEKVLTKPLSTKTSKSKNSKFIKK